MNKKKPIIIISGATATGKTGTSIALAKKLNKNNHQSEIINFDSLLFYKDINIGTAKPSEDEMDGIKHWLIGINSIKDPINAADFNRLCIEKINTLHQRNVIPILIGGSAFYLRSIVKGMYQSPTISQDIKIQIDTLYKSKGISNIRNKLLEIDKPSYDSLHENDHYRIMRAYEYFLATGNPISTEKSIKDDNNPYDFSQPQNPDWAIHHIYLEISKDNHWEIMQNRVEQMIKDGLIQEVKGLLNDNFDGTEKPLSSIGYKETLSYINGDITSQTELIEKIYIATRRLAKSQKTFFNKIVPKSTFQPLTQQVEIQTQTLAFLERYAPF